MRASLTVRLVAGVVFSQLLLAGGLVWVGIVFTRRQLREAFDAGLQGRLMNVAALVRYPESGTGLLFDASLLPPARDLRHPSFYQVRDERGNVIASSFPAEVALPPPGPPPRAPSRGVPSFGGVSSSNLRFWLFRYGGADYRGVIVNELPILDTEENLQQAPAKLTVSYAAPMLEIEAEVAAAGVAIAGASLVLLLLASLLAVGAIRRELHPLHELAQRAAAISPHNWSFQPGARTAAIAELQPLIQALELMLGRLHVSYQQQREFMADAAHHLKTPVAILKSTLQSLLRRPRGVEEYQASAQASLLDVERLEQLLQRMLRLARMEQWAEDDRPRRLPLADLGGSCQSALERVRPLAEARGVRLRGVGLEGTHRLRADPDDLEQVWVNLLENAVQHSPAGSEVEIRCAVADDAARVTVRDQGTGIAAEDAPHVFERFRRGASSGPGGFGLGLAIARTIVEAYGGEIEIEPQAGPGAQLRVTLRGATRGELAVEERNA